MLINSPTPRKLISHDVYFDGKKSCIVFVTAVVKARRSLLANHIAHEILHLLWTDSSRWLVGRYTILPDHLHLFASPRDTQSDLDLWLHFWKSHFRRMYKNSEFEWQAGSFNRRLRNNDSYDQKWHYVRENPVRHGFVNSHEQWKFQGEIHLLGM